MDQTTSITPAGQTNVPFTYAGTSQSERTSARATTAQNGLLGVETETTAGATTTYVRGPGGDLIYEHTPTAGDYYYYFDGLGWVIGLVDATNGNQRAAYTYDPYGANATATGVNGGLPANPWRWMGGYLDATGLYHFGARYYDPTTGRFTQMDPVLGGSCTGYDYACDSPINNVDLTGRFCLTGKNPNGTCRSVSRGIGRAAKAVADNPGKYFAQCVRGVAVGAVTGVYVAGLAGAAAAGAEQCAENVFFTALTDGGINPDYARAANLATTIVSGGLNFAQGTTQIVEFRGPFYPNAG